MGDGVVNGVGRGLEQVRETNVEAAFAQANGGVEGGEAAEADIERRDRRTRAEAAVLVFEDGDEGGRCRGFYSALFSWGRRASRREGGCGRLVEESRRLWSRGKELQELTQGRWAGMFRCGQDLSLPRIWLRARSIL